MSTHTPDATHLCGTTTYEYWDLPGGDRLHRWSGAVDRFGLSGSYDNLIELSREQFDERMAALTEKGAPS